MVPPGPPTPLGGTQPGAASLLRSNSNSGLLGGQGGPMSSQSGFPSLVSPRNQFNNMNNMLGNVPNVSSLLHQSFGNGGPSNSQRGPTDNGTESDPHSMGNGMGYSSPSPAFVNSNMANSISSTQAQGHQFQNTSLRDQQQPQQGEPQHNHQSLQQFSVHNNNHQQPHQQQYQSIRGSLAGVGPVKMEPQVTNDQQGLRNLGPESQQIQNIRNLPPIKMEPQHNDQSLFLHQQQQQQQQQFLHMSRQSPQAAAQINLLHQQRLLQLQHQQQQQLLKAIPQQRSPLQPQFQPQNLPLRSSAKPVYEPGMCARKLTHYMYQQQHRPEDNNIEFWRKFVAEYFTHNAKKKWCVSMYGSGRQTTGVFPQDVWHCEICNRKPGRGFEATAEVLPRLFKIKYESGTQEELLYVDMPREYQNSSGQIVLDYAKAIQESIFEQLRVVRDGQLRIVFSPDLKICSWEFCARRHEELIPRRLLIPQVSQLGATAQKYQAATQNASSNLSVPELQSNCNMFIATARQLAKALEVPLVNDLGYTKRYVRCLQISEVVNSMKDLIDYSRETGTGPMESLAKFPRRTNTSSGFNVQSQQPEEQQTRAQNSNNDNSAQVARVNISSLNLAPNASSTGTLATSGSTLAGLLHQNSMNSRQQNPMSNNSTSPYGGSGSRIPSPGQPNHPSPFQSPTPSSSNNPPQTSLNAAGGAHMSSSNSPNISGDADLNDSHSSVQKIINEMLMSSQLGGGSGMLGANSDVKNVNGLLPPSNNTISNGGDGLFRNGMANGNSGLVGPGFGNMGNGLGPSSMGNGIRAAMGNNNGRVGVNTSNQHDMRNQMLGGLGAVNGFNNLQFDWKASP
ncbi:hypothetical protein LguiB_017700 [Lonicera macranthoides]